MTTRRLVVLGLIVIGALLQPAAPADAKRGGGQVMRPLTPRPWTLAEQSNGCGTVSAGVCSASSTPTADPGVLQPHLRVADPVDPVPIPGYAHKFARYQQVAEVTTTTPVPSVTFDWRFVIDAPLGATSRGTQGNTTWTTQITTDVESTYCSPVTNTTVVVRESNTIIAAGTTYAYRFTFQPCAGQSRIPAGTTMKVTADVWLNLTRGASSDSNGWNGGADLTGAVRSVITADAV